MPGPRIDIHAVCEAIGPDGKPAARSTVYRKMAADPSFPKPIHLNGRLQWYQDEITHWIDNRPRRQYTPEREEHAA